jgi:deazaflavin-dependent oxidoreductase (nitroreductase family)
MPKKIGNPRPPAGLKRLMFRAPIWLYKVGLGSILGGRFLLLNHTGRKSGQPRQTVLEVVNFDPLTGTYYVASGFGKNSDWLLNIEKSPDVEIQVRNKRIPATALVLDPDESGNQMIDYARRNPHAAKELMRICGYEVDGSTEDYFIMGHNFIPFISLSPRN